MTVLGWGYSCTESAHKRVVSENTLLLAKETVKSRYDKMVVFRNSGVAGAWLDSYLGSLALAREAGRCLGTSSHRKHLVTVILSSPSNPHTVCDLSPPLSLTSYSLKPSLSTLLHF